MQRIDHRGLARLVLFAALVVLAFGSLPAAVLAAPTSASIPVYTYQAKEYSFSGPDQIGSGLATFVMQNVGKELHHMQLLRFHEGKGMADFQAALKSGDLGALFAIADAEGGVSETPPGGTAQATLNLQPGNYLLVCFISGADNVPHAAKGMVKALQVTANPAAAGLTPPQADVTVHTHDFAFVMPAQIPAGQHTWALVNDGPQAHEMALVKLEPGKTLADVQAYMGQQNPSGPPPGNPVPGLQAVNAGMTEWATLDLQPGTYIAICHVPDPKTGKSHDELGMIQEFMVSGGTGQAGGPPGKLPVTGAYSLAPWLSILAAALALAAGWLLRRGMKRA